MEKPKRRNSILKRASIAPPPVESATPKQCRRISFSGKNTIKEFIPGDDKVTIWGKSYEESAQSLTNSNSTTNASMHFSPQITSSMIVQEHAIEMEIEDLPTQPDYLDQTQCYPMHDSARPTMQKTIVFDNKENIEMEPPVLDQHFVSKPTSTCIQKMEADRNRRTIIFSNIDGSINDNEATPSIFGKLQNKRKTEVFETPQDVDITVEPPVNLLSPLSNEIPSGSKTVVGEENMEMTIGQTIKEPLANVTKMGAEMPSMCLSPGASRRASVIRKSLNQTGSGYNITSSSWEQIKLNNINNLDISICDFINGREDNQISTLPNDVNFTFDSNGQVVRRPNEKRQTIVMPTDISLDKTTFGVPQESSKPDHNCGQSKRQTVYERNDISLDKTLIPQINVMDKPNASSIAPKVVYESQSEMNKANCGQSKRQTVYEQNDISLDKTLKPQANVMDKLNASSIAPKVVYESRSEMNKARLTINVQKDISLDQAAIDANMMRIGESKRQTVCVPNDISLDDCRNEQDNVQKTMIGRAKATAKRQQQQCDSKISSKRQTIIAATDISLDETCSNLPPTIELSKTKSISKQTIHGLSENPNPPQVSVNEIILPNESAECLESKREEPKLIGKRQTVNIPTDISLDEMSPNPTTATKSSKLKSFVQPKRLTVCVPNNISLDESQNLVHGPPTREVSAQTSSRILQDIEKPKRQTMIAPIDITLDEAEPEFVTAALKHNNLTPSKRQTINAAFDIFQDETLVPQFEMMDLKKSSISSKTHCASQLNDPKAIDKRLTINAPSDIMMDEMSLNQIKPTESLEHPKLKQARRQTVNAALDISMDEYLNQSESPPISVKRVAEVYHEPQQNVTKRKTVNILADISLDGTNPTETTKSCEGKQFVEAKRKTIIIPADISLDDTKFSSNSHTVTGRVKRNNFGQSKNQTISGSFDISLSEESPKQPNASSKSQLIQPTVAEVEGLNKTVSGESNSVWSIDLDIEYHLDATKYPSDSKLDVDSDVIILDSSTDATPQTQRKKPRDSMYLYRPTLDDSSSLDFSDNTQHLIKADPSKFQCGYDSHISLSSSSDINEISIRKRHHENLNLTSNQTFDDVRNISIEPIVIDDALLLNNDVMKSENYINATVKLESIESDIDTMVRVRGPVRHSTHIVDHAEQRVEPPIKYELKMHLPVKRERLLKLNYSQIAKLKEHMPSASCVLDNLQKNCPIVAKNIMFQTMFPKIPTIEFLDTNFMECASCARVEKRVIELPTLPLTPPIEFLLNNKLKEKFGSLSMNSLHFSSGLFDATHPSACHCLMRIQFNSKNYRQQLEENGFFTLEAITCKSTTPLEKLSPFELIMQTMIESRFPGSKAFCSKYSSSRHLEALLVALDGIFKCSFMTAFEIKKCIAKHGAVLDRVAACNKTLKITKLFLHDDQRHHLIIMITDILKIEKSTISIVNFENNNVLEFVDLDLKVKQEGVHFLDLFLTRPEMFLS